MRTSNWSAIIGGFGVKLVAGLVLTTTLTWTARAQGPAGRFMPAAYESSLPSGGYGPQGGYDPSAGHPGANSGYLPASYQEASELSGAGPAAGPEFGGYNGAGPMTPWPSPSIYGPRFAQQRNDGGLWHYDEDNSASRRYFGIDFLWMETPAPGEKQVGHPVHNPPSGGLSANLNGIDHSLGLTGFRTFVGIDNPDETGFQLSGFWLNRGTNGMYQPAFVTRPIAVQLYNPATSTIGQPAFFDKFLAVDNTVQTWGAQGDWFATPLLGGKGNMLRADYGVRYMGIAQELDFSADDTVVGRFGLHSAVKNQLVGPQAGLRWDFGGDALKITGTGIAGALVNFEKTELSTFNYNSETAILGGAGGASGFQEESHTKISPMLEFGFTAEMPLFSYLPLINRVPVIRDGVFRIGYTWTGIFITSRPSESFTWTTPLPRLDYTANKMFQLQGANFGIKWTW